MKVNIFYLVYLIASLVCPVRGLSQIDYKEILINDKVTESGRYISYFTMKNKVKTGYVKDVYKDTLYNYGEITDDTILTDRYFVGWNYNERLLFVTNFNTNKSETIERVSSFKFDTATNMLICYDNMEKKVTAYCLKTKLRSVFDEVKYFNYSEGLSRLLIINQSNQITIFNTVNSKYNDFSGKAVQNQSIKNCIWNENTKGFVLFTKQGTKFGIFEFEKNELGEIFKESLINKKKNYAVDTTFLNVRLLNNKKIALGIKYHSGIEKKETPTEIWLGNDNDITTSITGKIKDQIHLAVIDLKSKTTIPLMDTNKLVQHKINTYDDTIYEMEVVGDFRTQYPRLISYYYDHEINEKHKMMQFENNKSPIFNSRYFSYVYYNDGVKWLSYNHKIKSRILGGRSNRFSFPASQNFSVYKKRWLIFSDRTDVWFYDSQTNTFDKKTDGRMHNKEFRVLPCNYELFSKPWSFSTERDIQNYNDILVKWHTSDFKMEGLSLISEFSENLLLVESNDHYDQVKRAQNVFTYIKEGVNTPPALYIYDKNSKKEKLIYQSNKNDNSVKDIVSEYVEWKNQKDEVRGAIIRFPMSYDHTKSYPAIVNVYEKKMHTRNHYTHNNEIYGNLINYRNYIADGYFIIEPDIHYTESAPGQSAALAVNEALDFILSKYSINSERVGITGHSFGGYETNFIITQNNRFAAAVSSAGVTDLISFYHTVNWSTLKPDMWRMETQQFRMGKSFYDIPEQYKANSPIEHVKKIQTPLLLLTGKEDYQVNWNQSIMMFLALKRLKKDVNLLLYPNEGHVLMNDENRKDANFKIKSWFDYHLKEKEKPQWLLPQE